MHSTVLTKEKLQMKETTVLDVFNQYGNVLNTFFNVMPSLGLVSLVDLLKAVEDEVLEELAKEKGIELPAHASREMITDEIISHMRKPDVFLSYFQSLRKEQIAELEQVLRERDGYISEHPELLTDLQKACYIGMQPDGSVMVPQDVRILCKIMMNDAFNGK